jgi:hypothetical protein
VGKRRHITSCGFLVAVAMTMSACAAKQIKGRAVLGRASTAAVAAAQPQEPADAAKKRVRDAVRSLKKRLQQEDRARARGTGGATSPTAPASADERPVGTTGVVGAPEQFGAPAMNDAPPAPPASSPASPAATAQPHSRGREGDSSPRSPGSRRTTVIAASALLLAVALLILIRRAP